MGLRVCTIRILSDIDGRRRDMLDRTIICIIFNGCVCLFDVSMIILMDGYVDEGEQDVESFVVFQWGS